LEAMDIGKTAHVGGDSVLFVEPTLTSQCVL
jgi:hypothetical protein